MGPALFDLDDARRSYHTKRAASSGARLLCEEKGVGGNGYPLRLSRARRRAAAHQPPTRAAPGDPLGDPPSSTAAAAAACAGEGTPCMLGASLASGAAVGMGVARPEPWAWMHDSACK